MINWIHSRLHHPDRGWDPVPAEHAAAYAAGQWRDGIDAEVFDGLESWIGDLRGKTVLDLGGGPGHYSVAFAQRGADVTWFDISRRYMGIVGERASEAGVSVRTALGYMDDAAAVLGKSFDVVFNRVCWNYCRDDQAFSRVIWSLVAPGGLAYVDTTPDTFHYDRLSSLGRLQVWMNRHVGWKVGHPFPPRGRIGRLMSRFPAARILIDNSRPLNDRLWIQKRALA